MPCSPPWTRSRNGSTGGAISSAGGAQRRIGGCSRRWCASTRSITATSSATCDGSRTTPTSLITCVNYQAPGVAETVNMDHIKRHYYHSHESINPRRIVAKGPDLDFGRPHDRARLPADS